MKRFFLFSLLVVSGCAAPKWVKYGATEADAIQEKARCKYEASAATASIQGNPVGAGMQSALLEHQCMEAKGYRIQ